MIGLHPRASRPAGALAALLLLALVSWPGPASAHARLVSSSPAQDDVLATAPTSISFEFSEAMASPAYVVVTGPDGTAANVGEPVVDDNVVTQQVAPGAPDGTWTTAVRAVSMDGHPLTAQITFSVGDGALEEPPAAPDVAGTPTEATGGDDPATVARADASGWTRGRTDLVVALGIFGLAGLLLLLARRAPP